MEPLGVYLAERGISVTCPVLAGHMDVSEMESAGWKEWRATAMDALEELRAEVSQVFLVGFSLGGLIAFDLAASTGLDLAGVVAINTPIKLASKQVLRAHLMRYRNVPGQEESVGDRVPMSCVSSLYDYASRVEALLPIVTLPVLVIQSKQDDVVDPQDAKTIRNLLGAEDKKVVWVDEGSHLVVLEKNRMCVFEAVFRFLKERAPDGVGGDEAQ